MYAVDLVKSVLAMEARATAPFNFSSSSQLPSERWEFLFPKERWGLALFEFNCQTFNCRRRGARACSHQATVPLAQTLLEEHTHGRTRALWVEFFKR